jgi:thioredoxin 1
MFDSPINTTDQSLERVLAAGLPVILIFLDGPAADDLRQSMEKQAREYAGQLLVIKVQTSDNPLSAGRYQISRTPAVVAIRNGNVESSAEGIAGRDLEAHVNFLLGKGPRPAAPQTSPERTSPQREAVGSAPQEPLTVTDANFDQLVLRSSLPVLVDFWAPWCGPCRMTDPIVAKLASEMSGRLVVAKLNVDENPQSAMRYDIRSIPTMMVVKDGQILDRWMGALPEPSLRDRISRLV